AARVDDVIRRVENTAVGQKLTMFGPCKLVVRGTGHDGTIEPSYTLFVQNGTKGIRAEDVAVGPDDLVAGSDRGADLVREALRLRRVDIRDRQIRTILSQ